MNDGETGEAIDARARVVARARSYCGPDGGPALQDPNDFFKIAAPDFADKGLEKTKSWCGIFALAVYIQEGLWPADAGKWIDGVGFALPAVKGGWLRRTLDPQPGDLVIFGPPLWHHAIFERQEGAKLYTVDGNVLGIGKEGCKACTHLLTGTTSFYSIAPLIS